MYLSEIIIFKIDIDMIFVLMLVYTYLSCETKKKIIKQNIWIKC